MGNALKKEFEYFQTHQDDLVREYDGKVVVIVGSKVVGVYKTELEALNEARKKYELGEFLIQTVRPGVDAYSQTYHSRVGFA